MSIVSNEASLGYTLENRQMVQAFLDGRLPDETWHDGLAVTEYLMARYKSAEEGDTTLRSSSANSCAGLARGRGVDRL